MSKSELESLEREVEEARARLAADLERLSSPKVFSGLKAEVSRDFDQLKQQAIDTTKEVARERLQDIVEMVTDRIAANPAAAAAIGAGIAWRLFRHPPISTALIGVGLYGLLKSNGNGTGPDRHRTRRNGARRPGRGRNGIDWNAKAEVFADNARGQAADAAGLVRKQVAEAAGIVQKQASDAASAAGKTIGEAADVAGKKIGEAVAATRKTVGDVAGSAAAQVSEVGAEVGEATRRTVSRATDAAAAWTAGGRRKVSRLAEETSPRDAVLLGAAAVAIATAIGLAAQRRRD